MPGRLRRMWDALRRPPVSLSLGAVLIIGALSAWLFLGAVVVGVEQTSTNGFCVSCHEMDIPAKEYEQSVHFKNATGVTATCSHCHIPQHSYVLKIARKTQAGVKDVIGKMAGKISTPEKYEAHRKEMAEVVWASMKSNDSRECRFCHDRDSMDPEKQGKMASKRHATAVADGKTCIDCHQGIAHTLPAEPEDTTAPAAEPAPAAAAPSKDESAHASPIPP